MTEHTAKILSILRRFKGWATRLQIADQLGADRLEGNDAMALNLLVERGLIEARYTTDGWGGRTLEYRFVELDDEADTRPVDSVE